MRQLLSATNPLPLASLDGSNGVRLVTPRGDGSGVSVSGAGDVNGDGYDDVIVGASSSGNASDGAAYVVFGSGAPFNPSFDLLTLDGANGFRVDGVDDGDYTGVSVSSAGDVNGDGYSDLIIGAYGVDDVIDDRKYSYSGEAYVVFGKAGAFPAVFSPNSLDGINGFKLDGVAHRDHFGEAVSTAGDVNGDGYDDLLVGAPFAESSSGVGDAYVVFGKATGFSAVVGMTSLDGSNGFLLDAVRRRAGERVGQSVSAAGDVNGDGVDDLIIGAPNGDNDPNILNDNQGNSYVVFGRTDGFAATIPLADLNGTNGFRLEGIDINDQSGGSVSGAGDVNGDGIVDLIIGARSAEPGTNDGSNEGEAYVVFGTDSGFPASMKLADLNGTNGFRVSGIDPHDEAGKSVSGAGDVNGDGYDDLIIGAHRAGINGESYVVFGKGAAFGAEFRLSDIDGTNGFRIDGASAGDLSGGAVGGAGDVNGDGFDDLIIGAIGGGAPTAGESYIVFGGNFTGGVETQVGTNGPDTLTADRGVIVTDILIGGHGSDILYSDGGPDVLIGGHGDDFLSILNADFSGVRRVRGGRGFDTLRIRRGSVPVFLNFTNIADNRITGIELIDIVDTQNSVTLNHWEVLNLSNISNTLTVYRSNGATVDYGTGWTQQANLLWNSRTYEVFTQGAATLQIYTAPTVSLAASSASVVEDGSGNLVYTFTRDVATGPLTVDFAVSGSAAFSTDYSQTGASAFSANSGSVTFAAGQTVATVTVSPTADNLVELSETVNLTLLQHPNQLYLVGSQLAASGTITDDDAATFRVNDVTVNEDAATMRFDVSTSNPVDTSVFVQVTFTGTTASGGTASGDNTDFVSTTQTVIFGAGDANSKFVFVPIVDDDLVELTESFSISLSTTSPLGTRVADFSDVGTGEIVDNDTATFTINDVTVHETDGTTTFTLSLDKALDMAADLDVVYTDNTAVGASGGIGADYDNDADRVTFPAGSTTDVQVTVAITDDNVVTGERTFTAALNLVTDVGARRVVLTDTGQGTILDNAAAFTISDVTVDEDAGNATFTISLDNPLDIPVDIDVSYADGTAIGAADGTSADFANDVSTVRFEAGETDDKTITVAITDDDTVEGTQTFSAMLSTNTELGLRTVLLDDTATGTITDNDTAGYSVSKTQTTLTEAGTSDTFDVVLTSQPLTDVTFEITSEDTSEAIVSHETLTFTPANWNESQTVTVTGVADSEIDGDKTTTITVSVQAAESDVFFQDLDDSFITATTTDLDTGGNIDGDTDFDANDSFLIHLTNLAGTDEQVNQSKGSSSLSPVEIRNRIANLKVQADVDGDGDFDANDSFLIHLVKLSGTNQQIDLSRGGSSLTADQIRANIDALGTPSSTINRNSKRIAAAKPEDTFDQTTPAQMLSSTKTTKRERLFAELELINQATQHPQRSTMPGESSESDTVNFSEKTFRSWIDSI
ncbi:beta strand repeat-containing protein [Fuerstiella marisgermanici]|uniref:beta strand repeat-containing protein n=1 Tax=Fuerstiella marisgermanici TaxID=1891926 RepID=UPI00097CAA7A|nr:Calx-beta domain-containing protein [Fuerstiella marisgermanici]